MQDMATSVGRGPRLWVPGDWNAFFGFGTNILVNILVLTGLLRFVLKMPDELVFGRILPATGLMLFLSTVYYAYLGYSVARKTTGRSDVCALPSGISVPAHVRRHLRGDAADPRQDERPRPGLGSRSDLGFRAEFRADGRRVRGSGDPQDHAAGGPAGIPRRDLHHLHLDAPRPAHVRDTPDRDRVLRHHPGQLVRRRALRPRRSGRPRGDRGRHADRLGVEPLRARLRRPEPRGGRGRRVALRLLAPASGRRATSSTASNTSASS